MPYIPSLHRQTVLTEGPKSCGELNYCLTLVILAYQADKGLSYATINDIIGALESCKAEYQRRVVASYEDQKIRENGDVYDR